MKHRVIIMLVVLLALLAAACAPASTPAPTPTQLPANDYSTQATDEPQAKATEPAAAANTPAANAPAATPAATPDIEKVIKPQPNDWKRGPDGAGVTIIEWSDFQCPYCAAVAPQLKRLADAYPNDVQIVFRHFPLPSHPLSLISAQAAEAAGAQGKFWEMNDMIFANQETWSAQSEADFRKTLAGYAEKIGLDVNQFNSELDTGKYKTKTQAAQDLAMQLGIGGTPFLLLNGEPWPQSLNYLSYNNLDGIVKYIVELPKKQYKEAPKMQIDKNKSYTATIKTDQGDIVLKLFADKAPLAVNNFVFLAKEGWYDGVTFHRVLADFMAQAGDPTGLGMGGPGYEFPNEITGLKFDKEGLLAMANAGPDTNGSQFFITYAPAPNLDAADPTKEAKYTIFGEVISGMDVAKKLTLRDPNNDPDTNGSVIKTITIEEQ
jgi:cyclophilin family peptidyl-prolyl cis-trans isomerase/protein-disulfide isomerase